MVTKFCWSNGLYRSFSDTHLRHALKGVSPKSSSIASCGKETDLPHREYAMKYTMRSPWTRVSYSSVSFRAVLLTLVESQNWKQKISVQSTGIHEELIMKPEPKKAHQNHVSDFYDKACFLLHWVATASYTSDSLPGLHYHLDYKASLITTMI